MFDYIEGDYVARISDEMIILDLHGVGLQVNIIPQVWSLLPQPGSKKIVRLYISLHVTEKIPFTFYGFDERVTRDFFNKLKSVSGCGPKTALSILARFPIKELAGIIEDGNTDALLKIKGIGGKIAARLLVELKTILKKMKIESQKPPESLKGRINESLKREVKSVLLGFGYIEKEISWVFSILADRLEEGTPTIDKIVAAALDEFGKKRENT